MATLLSDFVWEGLSTEPRPTTEQGARDGHILKELDTGESYIRVEGTWIFINLGLSFIKATKSGTITTDTNGFYHVAFVTPFISAAYSVALSTRDTGTNQPVVAHFTNIAVSGFDIYTKYSRTGNPVGGRVVSWLATRDYNP
jgi:hypothetical protein